MIKFENSIEIKNLLANSYMENPIFILLIGIVIVVGWYYWF
jgi:hypothetical protein